MSTNATAGHNLSINVNQVDIVGIPAASSVYNQFDDFGLLIGLNRLPTESSVSFKQRLLDVFVHKANSTYIGMMNGITRELGLSFFKPFRLRPTTSTGTFIAEDPVFIFNGPFLELWRDHNNGVLEMEIDIFHQTGSAYTIKELFNYINAHSTYFIADQFDSAYQYQRSMTILNQSDVSLITAEPIPAATNFTLSLPALDGGRISLTDVTFTDTFTFSNMVSASNLVLTQGDYYINAYTGDVVVFSAASNGTIIRYKYVHYNDMYLRASPIIIHNMQNDNFNRLMFQQVLADDGKLYSGIPTEFGADIINELLSSYPLYYGT